jgi:hypothetical protein
VLRWFASERLAHVNHAAPDSFSIGYANRYRLCMSLVQPDQGKVIQCINNRHFSGLIARRQLLAG